MTRTRPIVGFRQAEIVPLQGAPVPPDGKLDSSVHSVWGVLGPASSGLQNLLRGRRLYIFGTGCSVCTERERLRSGSTEKNIQSIHCAARTQVPSGYLCKGEQTVCETFSDSQLITGTEPVFSSSLRCLVENVTITLTKPRASYIRTSRGSTDEWIIQRTKCWGATTNTV